MFFVFHAIEHRYIQPLIHKGKQSIRQPIKHTNTFFSFLYSKPNSLFQTSAFGERNQMHFKRMFESKIEIVVNAVRKIEQLFNWFKIDWLKKREIKVFFCSFWFPFFVSLVISFRFIPNLLFFHTLFYLLFLLSYTYFSGSFTLQAIGFRFLEFFFLS